MTTETLTPDSGASGEQLTLSRGQQLWEMLRNQANDPEARKSARRIVTVAGKAALLGVVGINEGARNKRGAVRLDAERVANALQNPKKALIDAARAGVKAGAGQFAREAARHTLARSFRAAAETPAAAQPNAAPATPDTGFVAPPPTETPVQPLGSEAPPMSDPLNQAEIPPTAPIPDPGERRG